VSSNGTGSPVLVYDLLTTSTNFEGFCLELRFIYGMSQRMTRIDHSQPSAATDFVAESEELVQQYYAYLHRLAFSILDDDQEADDAAQESLLRALKNLDRLQAETNMKSWLSIITVNIARDMLRRRAARQRLNNLLVWGGILPSHQESPEKAVITSESRSLLWQAVSELDEKHRLPVLLRYLHDLNINEIARALGTNEGTIHSRLHYAIRKLQARLGDALQPAAFDSPERG
jgi:RNA polymerase sigma-70 factor (ECF subfamily)